LLILATVWDIIGHDILSQYPQQNLFSDIVYAFLLNLMDLLDDPSLVKMIGKTMIQELLIPGNKLDLALNDYNCDVGPWDKVGIFPLHLLESLATAKHILKEARRAIVRGSLEHFNMVLILHNDLSNCYLRRARSIVYAVDFLLHVVVVRRQMNGGH